MKSGIIPHNTLPIFSWSVRTQQQGERAGMRGERDTKGGKCCRFPSRCTSNPQAWALKTSAHKRHKVNIQRETGHMAKRRTHLRHSYTYVSNYKYKYTQMCVKHSLNTYTSIHKHMYWEPIHSWRLCKFAQRMLVEMLLLLFYSHLHTYLFCCFST